MIRYFLAFLAGIAVTAAAGGAGWYYYKSPAHHDYPEAESYLVSDDAEADVDAALVRAAEADKRVLLVMGANWCHDSRALAGWLESERIAGLVAEKYELVFVNVGMPQRGDGHNLGIAQRFGVEDLPGTPNLLVLTADGELVNSDTATTWRDASTRSEDAIFDELEMLARTDA
ncbi:thioredoxin family protein [Erythrobacter crassostreae]|uniref:Thioredoxin family protein n=1 Tax=Erythrobacter crassostreae TaxID=2828328 RepID=A0A9X1F3J7_9SPHN|nr:thioredoxin family protein [Erythrobacter crassostrea]MBV7258170.1 thioredoxin family protein [Erythrobacter crassostrea]